MAGIAANPPPQSRMPDKLLNDDELRPYFNSLQEDLYRVWLRSGGGNDTVSEIVNTITLIIEAGTSTTNQAELNEINERLGSGDAFTCSETGFKCSSTKIRCSRTETG